MGAHVSAYASGSVNNVSSSLRSEDASLLRQECQSALSLALVDITGKT